MKVRPTEPVQLLDRLRQIFPRFRLPVAEYGRDAPSLHGIMVEFLAWFGINAGSLDEASLQQLAAFLDESVAIDDALENAVATCFLEHLRQVGGHQVLSLYLSKRAKAKSRA